MQAGQWTKPVLPHVLGGVGEDCRGLEQEEEEEGAYMQTAKVICCLIKNRLFFVCSEPVEVNPAYWSRRVTAATPIFRHYYCTVCHPFN